jgi:hypothetical protein
MVVAQAYARFWRQVQNEVKHLEPQRLAEDACLFSMEWTTPFESRSVQVENKNEFERLLAKFQYTRSDSLHIKIIGISSSPWEEIEIYNQAYVIPQRDSDDE